MPRLPRLPSLAILLAGTLARSIVAQEPPPAPPATEQPSPFDTPQWQTSTQLGVRRQALFDLAPTRAYLREPSREAALAATPDGIAWLLLGHLAAGSTLRSGPDREPLKRWVVALKAMLADDGRFGGFAAPVPRRDQLLLTLALAEAHRRSHYGPLTKPVGKAVAAALVMVAAAPPLSPEEYALLARLAVRLAETEALAAAAAACRDAAKAARGAIRPGASRRGDAALHLGDVWLGAAGEPALTVARCWPADPLADPLHTWFGVMALHTTDAATWGREWSVLEALPARRATDGPAAGGWATATGDPVLATAILLAVLGAAEEHPFPAGQPAAGPGPAPALPPPPPNPGGGRR